MQPLSSGTIDTDPLTFVNVGEMLHYEIGIISGLEHQSTFTSKVLLLVYVCGKLGTATKMSNSWIYLQLTGFKAGHSLRYLIIQVWLEICCFVHMQTNAYQSGSHANCIVCGCV